MTTDGQQERRGGGGKMPYCIRVVRRLRNAEVATELGPDVCWLLTVLVDTQDARYYAGPVSYWNENLQRICGFSSVGRLIRARQKAVDAGWLIYTPGKKGQAAQYRVQIPGDTTDDPAFHFHFQNETENEGKTKGKRRENGKHSYLIPKYLLPTPPPPSSTPTNDGGGGDEDIPSWDKWEKVEQRLARLGVVATRQIRERTRLSPEEASKLIDHFEREQRWKPSALHHRLVDGAPGLAPAEGWLPDDPELAQRKYARQDAECKRREADDRRKVDLARQICLEGKQHGKTEEEMRAVLQAKGLPEVVISLHGW